MRIQKHILLAGNTAFSMYNFRGKLIEELQEQGHRVTVVAPYDNIFTPKIVNLGCNFIPISINAKGTNPIQDLLLIHNYIKIFKKQKPDFIFCYTIKPNIYGSYAASWCNIPYIAVTTGLGYTFLNKGWISKVSKVLYKQAFKRAVQVWFLNDDDKHSFIENQLVKFDKAAVLKGEGIDLSRFIVKSTDKKEPVVFLLIARMLWDKGIGEFIEAARMLKQRYPDVKFQLLGAIGVDNPEAIDDEQIRAWQSDGIVEYLGVTENVIPFIDAATCVVLPSYREGIPFTLLEAAASGKPVVTTNVAGCKDVVNDGITGFLCEVKDPISLANCMVKIISLSPDQYKTMALAGRSKVELEFDVRQTVNKYIETLERSLQTRW